MDCKYTEYGDRVPSEFVRETDLREYEPASIEVVHSDRAAPLRELLEGISYGEQWLKNLTVSEEYDTAICVFERNQVQSPERCSLQYCGSFPYSP